MLRQLPSLTVEDARDLVGIARLLSLPQQGRFADRIVAKLVVWVDEPNRLFFLDIVTMFRYITGTLKNCESAVRT